MYKQLFDVIENKTSSRVILRTTDGATIPTDHANTDYQAYLAWVAEGNVPTPAEENT